MRLLRGQVAWFSAGFDLSAEPLRIASRGMFDTALRELLPLLQPVGFIWIGLVGLAILLWRRGERALCRAAAALALALFAAGGTALPGALLGRLERPFLAVKTAEFPAADAVVLLGGGAAPALREASGFHLTIAGDRILAALDLMRRGKAPTLVLGGAAVEIGGRARAESEAVRDWMLSLPQAVPGGPDAIVALPRCRDTHEEALRVRELARERGWRRILLVSSAWHLRRATATFRAAGLEVIPAPCNFLAEADAQRGVFGFSIPNQARLELFALWLHEQVGWLEYQRRGWLTAESADPESPPERP